MKRQSEQQSQQSLFDEDEPHVVLAAENMTELAALLEALLREIAAGFATGGPRQ